LLCADGRERLWRASQLVFRAYLPRGDDIAARAPAGSGAVFVLVVSGLPATSTKNRSP